MRRAARGAAWVVLLVTMATVSMYVGLLIHRRVSPPVVPVTADNNIAPYQQGDALLIRRISPADVTSKMVIAVRLKGRVVLGRVQSLHQDGAHLVYTLEGVRRSGTDGATERDIVGRADRRVPLVGYPLLWARARVVQVLGAALVVGTVVLLVFVGRTPLDYLEEDEPEAFELGPPEPLALPAGPPVRGGAPIPMPIAYVGPPMSITPDDLRQVRFAQTRKGYDTEAVDRALDTVADSLEAMLAERHQLVDRLRAAEAEIERYKQMESQLGQTLAMAERSAEQVKAEAQAEAQRLITEAQAQVAQAAPAGAPSRPDGATIELLGEMRAIRSLLQAALQPGGPLAQQRPPGQ